jgi:hypothetical protein
MASYLELWPAMVVSSFLSPGGLESQSMHHHNIPIAEENKRWLD